MSLFVAHFVGGPWDGKVLEIEDRMAPPELYVDTHTRMPFMREAGESAEPVIEHNELRYIRRAPRESVGGTGRNEWVYVLEGLRL